LTYAVEHIGGLHVFKLRACTHTHTHTHFIDPVPVFTVEYETSKEICIDHICTKDNSHVTHISQTIKYSKHTEYYEFT
jgi:hypothetical protein